MIESLKDKAGVEDIADFMNMEDDQRDRLLNLDEDQMATLAEVCNRYPNLELNVENSPKDLKVDTCNSGESSLNLVVSIKRDIDEAEFATKEEYLEELKVFA